MGAAPRARRSRSSATGSKRALGRPAQTDVTLDLSGLSGVTLYEPEELVLSAQGRHAARRDRGAARRRRPGARLRADGLRPAPRRRGRPRHDRRRARRQPLGPAPDQGRRRARPFPRRHRGLRPRRDLQVRRPGGEERHRLRSLQAAAGSWGTLAAMTEVTIKVLPRPETEQTLLIARPRRRGARDRGDDRGDGLARATCRARRTCRRRSPRASGRRRRRRRHGGHGAAAGGRRALGRAPPAHAAGAAEAVRRARARVGEVASRALWRAVRDATPFAAGRGGRSRSGASRRRRPRRRAGRADREASRRRRCSTTGPAGWSGSRSTPSDDARRRRSRGAVAPSGGHATLIRAPAALRAAVDVFEPQPAALAALDQAGQGRASIRRACSIPGRMWAGCS